MSTAAHMSILQSHQVKEVGSNECGNTWQFFRLPDTGQCFKIEEIQKAWNDTPYWLMEVPKEIIPDHSTIFTDRFIAMLQNLVPPADVVESPRTTPKLLSKHGENQTALKRHARIFR